MPCKINDTYNPDLQSWIESANDPESDFPIQNLPWCIYLDTSPTGGSPAGIGVRIGDMIVAI